jgi:hypothetical protein
MNSASITLNEGLFRAEAGLANDRPIDMEAYLDMLEPSRNPNLERMLRKFGSKAPKTRMKFQWRRRDLAPNVATVTVADAVAESHIEIDRYDLVHRDVGLFNTRTRELMICNEDAGVAPNATVDIRSYSHATPGTAALRYATVVGDKILILPEFHADGEDVPEAWRVQDSEDYDYIMQIDRRGSDISDIADAEASYDPRGQRAIDNQMAMIELMRDINLLFYVSQTTREVASASGARRHAMGGLRQKITSNRQSLAGVGDGLTPQVVGEILRRTKYRGASGNKTAVAGQYAFAAMAAWPVGSINVSPRETEWGFAISRIITPHGNLDVAYDDVLNDTNGLGDVMVILDEQHIRQVFLQGLGFKVIKKVSNLSTTHRIVDAITTTIGLQVKFEEMHAWIEDIS